MRGRPRTDEHVARSASRYEISLQAKAARDDVFAVVRRLSSEERRCRGEDRLSSGRPSLSSVSDIVKRKHIRSKGGSLERSRGVARRAFGNGFVQNSAR